jgi:histidine triad (HIT) family protein
MKYDPQNIFAKIIRHEIPCDKVYEDEFCVAFHDKFPVAKIHVLIVPKFDAVNFHDFIQNASAEFVANFYKSIFKTVQTLNLTDEQGYKIVMNAGANAGQTIFHYHVHVISEMAKMQHI